MTKKKLRRINPLVRHPLMGKCAAQGKPRKSERKRDKQALRREWSAVRSLSGLTPGYST
jgi:hypothetical protein